MGLTSLPTRTSGSLGANKVDQNVILYSTGVLPAGEWNTGAQAIYEMAQQQGLADGTTSGSLMSASFLVVSDSALPNQRIIRAGTGISFSNSGGSLTISSTVSSSTSPTSSVVWADSSASYLVLSATSSLANERVITAGVGIGFVDGGAGSSFTISSSILAGTNVTINQVGNSYAISSSQGSFVSSIAVVAPITSSGGLTPTLSISTASISAAGVMSAADKSKLDNLPTSFSSTSSSYVTLALDSTLSNERVLGSGPGITITDYGANSNVRVSASLLAGDNVTINQVGNSLAISASQGSFVSSVSATSPITSSGGATPVISISPATTASAGTLSAADKTKIDNLPSGYVSTSASYVTLTTDTTLTSERVLVVGPGLSLNDYGANSNVAISASLLAGTNVTINQVGNELAISASFPATVVAADVSASYIVISTTSSLPNERALAAGPGIAISDYGAGSTVAISSSLLAGDNVTINQVGNSYAISASQGTFVIAVSASAPLTSSAGQFPLISIPVASITAGGYMSKTDKEKLDSISVSASVITVTATSPLTASAGQSPNITLPAATTTAGGYMSAPDKSKLDGLPSDYTSTSASYVTLSTDGTLTNERVLTIGTGISMSDGGPNGNVVLSAQLLAGDNITINQVGNAYAISSSGGVSGSFVSSVTATAPLTSSNGLTPNISIINATTSSDGAMSSADKLKLDNLPSSFASTSASYIVVSLDPGLSNDRVLSSGPGIAVVDYGAGNSIAISASLLAGDNITINQVSGSYAISSSAGTSPVTHQYIGSYDSSAVTSSNPKTVGSTYFVPNESTKSSYALRTILATSTGSDKAFVQMYNVTSGTYVHIGGIGVTVLTTSNTTPSFLESVNLYGATNFNSSSASIYELQYYGSGSIHLTFHYGSEIVGT